MAQILDLEAYRKLRCSETPQSEQCTARLYAGTCPGKDSGTCSSSKFNPALDSESLPLFFSAQHA